MVEKSIITETETMRYIETNNITCSEKSKVIKISKTSTIDAVVRFYDSLDGYTKYLMTVWLRDIKKTRDIDSYPDIFGLKYIYRHNPTISYEYLLEFARIGEMSVIIKLVSNVDHYEYILDLLDYKIAMACTNRLQMKWILNYIHIRDHGKTIDGFEVEYVPFTNSVGFNTYRVSDSIKNNICSDRYMAVEEVLLMKSKAEDKTIDKNETCRNLDSQHPSTSILTIIDSVDFDLNSLTIDRLHDNEEFEELTDGVNRLRNRALRALRGEISSSESSYDSEYDEEESDWTSDEEITDSSDL